MGPLETTFESTPSPMQREENDDDYGIAAIILAVILIGIIIGVIVYSYCERGIIPDWCRQCLCPCSKARRDDIEMGYLPANITVNSAAVEQGVPDIFIRNSQSGRISMDPYSYDDSRNSMSTAETSGTWAEYLRRATLRRGSSARRFLVDRERVANAEADATVTRGSDEDKVQTEEPDVESNDTSGHASNGGGEVHVDHPDLPKGDSDVKSNDVMNGAVDSGDDHVRHSDIKE